MGILDKLHNHIDGLLKGTLEINPGLETIYKNRKFKKTNNSLDRDMRKQVLDLMDNRDFFKDIDNRLGKADEIWTESDEIEVQEAVEAHMKKLDTDDEQAYLILFLMWVYNQGGQDFINKHNLLRDFNLRNPDIIRNLEVQTKTVLKGIDDTTTKWVTEQIVEGRKAGQPYEYIADQIRDVVPETYEGRAERIVRTETSRVVGQAEHETAHRNGASHKQWVTVGGACPICLDNESQGIIGINEIFSSGDYMEPAHPNCRCLVEYVFTPFMGSVWSGE